MLNEQSIGFMGGRNKEGFCGQEINDIYRLS